MSQFEEKAREIARSTTDQLRGSTDAGPFHLAHHIPSMRKFIAAISLALGEAFEAGKGESLRERAVVNEAPDGSSPFGLPSLSQGAHRIGELSAALQYLHDDCADYAVRNNMDGAVNNYPLRRARLALGLPEEVDPNFFRGMFGLPLLERDLNPKECGDGVAPKGALHPGCSGDAWRPISTAPKDGTVVDLLSIDGLTGSAHRRVNCSWGRMVKWNGEEFEGWRGLGALYQAFQSPTHWMPIPQPPLIPDEEAPNDGAEVLRFWPDLGLPPQLRGMIEEAQSADEVSAADQPASLTQEITSLRSQLETLKEALEEISAGSLSPRMSGEIASGALMATQKAHSASVAAEEASEATSVGPNPSGRL
jgi:hypothetical protein